MKAHHDHDARHRADRRLLHRRRSTASAAATASGSCTREVRGARPRRSASAGAIPEHTTDLKAAIEHPTPTSSSSACRTTSTRRRSALAAAAGKAVLCTKPLGRTAEEARRMLETVEKAGVFGGYLEDLCYTPKTLKAVALGRRPARSAT